MSADEESMPAATDSPMADPKSNKRKVSVDDSHESDPAASPKRVKLEAVEAKTIRAEDRPAQETEPTPHQEVEATELKHEVPEDPKQEPPNRDQRDPSPPPPRNPSPKPSRSPTLSRRPSVATPEPRHAPASGVGQDRGRRSISEQEKKRGQRLFGGLLNTLSQKPAGQQQRKRQEIERRQQERAQQQRVEDDKRRTEKLARLNHVREIEQVKFDEEMMRSRHANMLAQARSLSTKSEPRLFYLPWKLTKAQEMLRKEQILDTAELIAKEAEEFQRRKRERLKNLGVTVGEPDHSNVDANGRAVEHRPAAPSASSEPVGVEPGDEKVVPGKAIHQKAGHENHHDDAGYVMVENEEDTVIY